LGIHGYRAGMSQEEYDRFIKRVPDYLKKSLNHLWKWPKKMAK